MAKFKHIVAPKNGQPIKRKGKKLAIPNRPIIPTIEGDGIGRDISKAMRRVVDAAVDKAYKGRKKIAWMDIYAGEKANELYGEWLPEETINAIKQYTAVAGAPSRDSLKIRYRTIPRTAAKVWA